PGLLLHCVASLKTRPRGPPPRLNVAPRRHGIVKDRRGLRMLREIREDRLAKDPVERRHPGFDAVGELSPGTIRNVVSHKASVAGNALRMIAPQALSERRELELPIAAFSKQAHARERPQQAIDTVFRNCGMSGDLATASCALRELVGDAKFYGGGDRLADPPAGHQHLGEDITLSGR